MSPSIVKVSKLLSLVLRHDPSAIGIALDSAGWVDVDVLISAINNCNPSWRLNKAGLDEVVATNNKKRFTYSDNGKKIRANQGHSIEVDLGLVEQTPPDLLFHGTSSRVSDKILAEGISKMRRQHVHLSADKQTATIVGARHGTPVVFGVESGRMHRDGEKFFLSKNGVWLTNWVSPMYLQKEVPQ